MDNLLLHRFVASLKDEEVKKAKRFLASPFHNTDPLLGRYFDLLCKHRPSLDHPSLKSEAVFRVLFAKEWAYDEKKLRNLRHKLTQALRSFLAHQSLEVDQGARQHFVVKALANRADHGLFFRETQVWEELLEKDDNRGIDYHWQMANLYHERYFHPAAGHFQVGDSMFWGAVNHLEKFFSLQMMCYEIEAETRHRYLNELQRFVFLGNMRNKVASLFEPGEMPAALFLQLTDLDHPYPLQYMLNMADELGRRIGPFELGILSKVLLNKAIVQSNKFNNLDSHRLVFQLYQLGLKKDIITSQELKDPIRFVNIAFAADLAFEFDWSFDFIEKEKAVLDEAVREAVVSLCLAHVHYHRGLMQPKLGDLGEAMRFISEVKHGDESIELRQYPLQLRIIYDNLVHDHTVHKMLEDKINNFKQFLARRKGISEQLVRGYLHFCEYLKELAALVVTKPTPYSEVSFFHQKLKAGTAPIVLKGWLLERAERLAQGAP